MARLGRSFPLNKRFLPSLGLVFYDNSSNSIYEAALSTYNWTHVVGTNNNRYLLVGVSVFAAGTVSSITLGAQNLTFLRSDTNGAYRSEIWYLVAPNSGAGTITVTLSASLTSIAGAVSYWNANQAAPDANFGGNGTNTPASASITPIAANTRIFGNLAAQTASGISDQIGQANRYRNQGALGTGAGAEIGTVINPASTTMQWNGLGTLDSWAVSLVSLKPPVGGTVYTSSLTATLSFNGTITKSTSHTTTATLSFISSFTKNTSRTISATLNFAGNLNKQTIKSAFTASLSFIGNFITGATRLKALTANLSFSGGFGKQTNKSLVGSLSFTGNIGKLIYKNLTATLTFIGNVNKLIAKGLSASLSFVGTFSGIKKVISSSPKIIYLLDGRLAIRVSKNIYLPL